MVEQRSQGTDRGFTLIEALIVISIIGIIVTSLSIALVVLLRNNPDTELRVDDARTTRGLATWLSHDTTSAPGFEPETSQGGINIVTFDTGDNNDCSGEGTNILHLTWTEQGFVTRVFVANYRFVVEDGEGRVVRYLCSRTATTPFGNHSEINLTSGLSPTTPPIVTLNRDMTGEVMSIDFALTGLSGEQVLVETGSRNPTESF